MDNAGYIGLSRNAGLIHEMNAIANNIANITTNGFRREGAIFAEHVKKLEGDDPNISIATLTRRYVDLSSGDIVNSGNALDFAIEGDGFFLVESQDGEGERLTRDGAFSTNAAGELISSSGARVLDQAGGAIVIPAETKSIEASTGGVIFADGEPVGRLGIVTADPTFLVREGQNTFRADGDFEPVEDPNVLQFAIEGSNVNAIEELARLIEVQRTYELTQNFSRDDGERINRTIRVLGQSV